MAKQAQKASKRKDALPTVVDLAHVPEQSDILTPSSQTGVGMLPRREDSSLRSLMSQDERMDLDVNDSAAVPTIQFLAQQMPPALAGEPIALQAIASMFSRQVARMSVGMDEHMARARELAAAAGSVTMPPAAAAVAAPAKKRTKELKRSRIVTTQGDAIGHYSGMEIITEGDERELARIERYYKDDRDDDAEYGNDEPGTYPMVVDLVRKHASEFERRQTVLETLVQDVRCRAPLSVRSKHVSVRYLARRHRFS
jgi:hypothetical protein